jgi:hypothetical protein
MKSPDPMDSFMTQTSSSSKEEEDRLEMLEF